MSKGEGTRSGLLWEVERLLNETKNLPQVLVMENVPQVHSKKNMPDFQKWLNYLESRGYKTFWQDLNAMNYGIPQSRNRCIAVSILGDYEFEFPKPIPLEKVMKDYLEDEVDERFYLTTDKAKELIDKLILNGKIAVRGGRTCIDLTINNPEDIQTANCIKARYDAGISNYQKDGTGVCECQKLT